jgi:hypothetical protein
MIRNSRIAFGICILIVTTSNFYDAVSVNVGSQLLPSSEVRALKGVRYTIVWQLVLKQLGDPRTQE